MAKSPYICMIQYVGFRMGYRKGSDQPCQAWYRVRAGAAGVPGPEASDRRGPRPWRRRATLLLLGVGGRWGRDRTLHVAKPDDQDFRRRLLAQRKGCL